MSKEKYVHKAGSGSLFKNQYKDSDAKPDMVGSATTLEGNVVELAGWTSTTQAGEKYVSIKMSPPYVKDDGALPKLTKEETSKVDADLPFLSLFLFVELGRRNPPFFQLFFVLKCQFYPSL